MHYACRLPVQAAAAPSSPQSPSGHSMSLRKRGLRGCSGGTPYAPSPLGGAAKRPRKATPVQQPRLPESSSDQVRLRLCQCYELSMQLPGRHVHCPLP